MKFIRRQSAGRQGGHQRAGARHRLHPKPESQGRFDHSFARVADAGTSGIGHQGDFFAVPQSFNDFFAAPGFIELVVTQ